jgi:putative membrane protein
MRVLATGLVAFVAIQHFGFLILEMFLWTHPIGLETFGLTLKFAEDSAALAANQGLYTGFLTAGLLWSLTTANDAVGKKVFFLGCVIVAGIFGAATASQSILFIQALPAALALAAVILANRRIGLADPSR